jgi:hypothetical protein
LVDYELIQLSASDSDLENSIIAWEIIGGNEADKFKIDSQGRLQLKNRIDYENNSDSKSYTLNIQASDQLTVGGKINKSAAIAVKIDLKNENDNLPQIIDEGVLEITENKSASDIIYQFKAEDLDGLELSKFTDWQIVSGDDSNYFELNATTGELTLLEAFDYESTQTYNIKIAVSDSKSAEHNESEEYELEIKIINENDNICTINTSSISEKIILSESELVDYELIQLSASDSDLENSIIAWEIIGGNEADKFKIDSQGILRLKNRIDYENNSDSKSYTLNIQASDQLTAGGKINKSAAIAVKIDLKNENDNLPQIIDEGILEITENKSVSDIIYQFKATDLDGLELSEFTDWQIVSGDDSNYFELNATTGELTLLKAFDYESTQTYNIKIAVSDSKSAEHNDSEEYELQIKIINENDNICTINTSSIPEKIILSESELVDYELVHLSASDSDLDNSIIAWEIIGGNEADKFKIDSQGRLRLKNTIDYENNSDSKSYTLNIQASDQLTAGGKINKSAAIAVKIDLKNENDNLPQIIENEVVEIFESTTVNTLLLKLKATDFDGLEKTQFCNWRIVDGDLYNHFRINSKTGYLYLNRKCDYEKQKEYQIYLQVDDNLHLGNSSDLQSLDIVIKNINDEMPVIEKNQVFEIYENTSIVGNLKYSDPDGEILSYLITGEDQDCFAYLAKTNMLILKPGLLLDYEKDKHRYKFNITISDGIQASKSESIIVNLLNSDDCRPEIILNESKKYFISENQPIHTKLAKFYAYDKDLESDLNNLNWQIYDGDGLGLFKIDSQTGELTSAAEFDYETKSSYWLRVSVDDSKIGSDNEKVISDRINILIKDLNDNIPVIAANQEFYVSEDSAFVGQLNINDPDGDIVWYMFENQVLFIFDKKEHVIKVKDELSLDFEQKQYYEFSVQVADNNFTSSPETIKIHVLDVNDNKPIINSVEEKLFISDLYNTNQTVVRLTANDLDGTDLTNISNWTIIDQKEDIFNIDQSTGDVYIQYPLMVKRDIYSISVQVSDGEILSDPYELLMYTKKQLNSKKLEKAILYPNPCKGEIKLLIKEEIVDYVDISVMDCLGRIVFEKRYDTRFIDIERKFLVGSYRVRIKNSGRVSIQSFIVE